ALTINGTSVSDVDVGAGILLETLTASNGGTLTLSGIGGLATITGNGSSSVTFSGTLAAVNTALASIGYQGASNFSGAATITLTTSDQGATGSGGTRTDTDT